MEPILSDSRMIRSRSQHIRGCVQIWARCLASEAQTFEEVLATEPTTNKARLNLREAIENALKEEWSLAAAAASTQTPIDLKAGMPEASTDRDGIVKGSSTATTSMRNTHLVEDVLWKEVFYKPLAMAKRLKRPNSWNANDMAIVRTYLEDGIDYYLSLLKLLSTLHSSTSDSSTTRTSVVVRCLCCLGDLSRYYCTDLSPKLPLLPGTSRYMVPAQYYHQVLELSPGAALAHSNLASVLRSIHNTPLQAALHYLAALRCSRFEGARVQLKQLLDHSLSKYSSHYEHNQSYGQQSRLEGHFLHTVLATVACFAGRDEVSHVEVNAICQDFLVQLGKSLQTSVRNSTPSGDPHPTTRGGRDCGNRGSESSETVLLAATLLVATHKLQIAQQGSTCAVLLASVLLTVVCQCLSALQHTITSLHSDDALLALTLATTPCPPAPPSVAGTSSRSSSGERDQPADRRTKAHKDEAKNTTEPHSQKKRTVARRRRIRRRPQANNSDWNSSGGDSDDDSSSEHFSSDRSNWSSDENSVASDEDSCSSDEDSGADVIIESEEESAEQGSIPSNKDDQKIVPSSSTTTLTTVSQSSTAVAPAANQGSKLDSASPPTAISALEHLKLIAISDGSEKVQNSSTLGHQEQHKSSQSSFIPTMKATSVENNGGVAALRTPPNSLLAGVNMLMAWLRAESVAKGTVVWCDDKSNNNKTGDCGEENPTAGKVESSRVLWKALAAYCNLICVDLGQLCSTVNLDQLLPNLKELMLLCRQIQSTAYTKTSFKSLMLQDSFILPEDDFLKSTVPSVVPQHVLQRPPGVQCPHVAAYLHHVGVTKTIDSRPISKTSLHNLSPPTICDEMSKLSLSEHCPNGVLSSKAPIVNGERPILNALEESLLRTLRIRNDLRQLSEFEECPVLYCEETGLFSVQPSANGGQSSGSSSTAGSGSNNNHKPYYLKKVTFGGYVMDKLVRRRTRLSSAERRPTYSGREEGKPNRRERRRSRKNRRQPNGGGRRNVHHQRGQEYPRETGYARRRGGHCGSEGLPGSGGRTGTGRQNKRRGDRSLNYWQTTDDSVEELAHRSGKPSHLVVEYVGHNSASSTGSAMSATASPVNHSDDANETFGLEDLKDAPLISPDTTTPTNGKFGAIGDRRKAVAAGGSYIGGCAAPASTGKAFGGSPVIPRACGSAVGDDDNEAAKKSRRDHGQRMLTARWLRHKLDTTDCKPLMYLVPDASAIVYHLDTIKAIVLQRQTVVVVPMQVLSDIDEAKRNESAARDASRWLDRVLLGRRGRVPGNPTLRLQGASERSAMPGVQCPPKHHKTAWRWFQILECCHHLSRHEYFPKEGASEETSTINAGVRGAGGSLYSDQHQQPVLKNKHKSKLSQQQSPIEIPGNMQSLVPKAQDDNLMDRAAVVTLLTAETGDTISKLPFELSSLASRVAAKLVFVADYKKIQTSSHGQT